MEYSIYRVIAVSPETKLDEDRVPYERWETIFDDMFSTKEAAVQKADSLSAMYLCYVKVVMLLVTEEGAQRTGVVYQKFINPKDLEEYESRENNV